MKNVNRNQSAATLLNDQVLDDINGGVLDSFIRDMAKKFAKAAKKIWNK